MVIKTYKGIRFLLYLIVVILLNLVLNTLFFRIDLTKNGTYSLSEISRKAVATLEEPLTIKAFFSSKLPPPYNNTEQILRDLLEEYALNANQFFNYSIVSVDNTNLSEGGTSGSEARKFEEEARAYSIYPIQIQNIERDEVKLQTAYMGVVFIHGDLMETIPALTSTDNLEYRITGMINRLNNKISALLSLKEDITVKLYLSSPLIPLGSSLKQLPDEIKAVVADLNKQNYDKLRFAVVDPFLNPEEGKEAQKMGIEPLILQTGQSRAGGGQEAYAALGISYRDRAVAFNLLARGLLGYQLMAPEKIKDSISGIIENIIGINEEIGYLTDYDTLPLFDSPAQIQADQRPALTVFDKILSDSYTIRQVSLQGSGVPESISTLIIAGPLKRFSEYDLFQIDQYLMKGKALALFLDTFREIVPQSGDPRMSFGQQPVYLPIDTGLENLLEHYGVMVKKSYVMDENCFIQRRRLATGGIEEIPFYFAPKISSENINHQLKFLKNIKGLVMLAVSPVETVSGQDNSPSVRAFPLISSSSLSWEVSKNINLYNPLAISPPSKADEKGSRNLAYLLEGSFTSFFKNKGVPVKTEESKEQSGGSAAISNEYLSGGRELVERTDAGRITVVGTSAILGNNVLNGEGTSPNDMFLLNLFDYLGKREDYALMRSKGQLYNPLKETKPELRTFIKSFNIVGLPIMTALIGIVVWLSWISRKKRIQSKFQDDPSDATLDIATGKDQSSTPGST
ncbi:MAG TPA: Gldg family protein [Spirochaetia bacterium]|nr:Gldg family protein [Spirochaetia bacterium]